MFKIFYFLLFDCAFIFSLIKFGDELGGFIVLFIGAIVFFSWELIRAIKDYFG